MDHNTKILTILQIEKRKWLILVGLVALTHLFCQSLMLPYGNALLSLLPNEKDSLIVRNGESSNNYSIENLGTNLEKESLLVGEVKSAKSRNLDGYFNRDDVLKEKGEEEKLSSHVDDDVEDNIDFIEDEALGNENVDLQVEILTQNDGREKLDVVTIGSNEIVEMENENKSMVLPSVVVLDEGEHDSDVGSPAGKKDLDLSYNKVKEISTNESHLLLGNIFASSENVSLARNKPLRKKMKSEMPPKTVTPIQEMEKILVHHRARSRAMRPRWSSERDQEISRAKLMIESAPILKNEQELYAPAFRNVSTFKRSYELMERLLKIYVYKEGEKPIFHQPIQKGLYASEGWFMKLMEGNKRFVVKDPRKAHLFYMPFSSRMLEYTLYVRNSHNRTNLRQYLREYSEKIAAKYRFWNRTGGADHFLVACHDWAPYETRHHMEHCIKALCNADVTVGFKIGRDVSFPETYVRSARNPLRDLGGKPPSQRHILAFYAGNMHGYLRPILLKHWKDKDPDMKILGPMPQGVASKMSYISYMKSSKYCICPKGYEVNSPRVVEAIFYECVPVIISDNFVPPFFEVLNWSAFSVIVEEKEIPNLKNILVNISEEKYLEMQLGVRRVQKHFLWHAKPVKYDLFHMTLHSIWYNRVFQLKLR